MNRNNLIASVFFNYQEFLCEMHKSLAQKNYLSSTYGMLSDRMLSGSYTQFFLSMEKCF